jgi:hypothetical protein
LSSNDSNPKTLPQGNRTPPPQPVPSPTLNIEHEPKHAQLSHFKAEGIPYVGGELVLRSEKIDATAATAEMTLMKHQVSLVR